MCKIQLVLLENHTLPHMTKYILLETLLGEFLPHLLAGLQIPLEPCQCHVMYCPKNIILEFGLRERI